MKIFSLNQRIKNIEEISKTEVFSFIAKSQKSSFAIEKSVLEIVENVKKNGDKALLSYCNKFDKTNFKKAEDFLVKKSEMEEAEKSLGEDLKKSLKEAFKRIKSYHQKQLPKDFLFKDKEGVELGNLWKNIESIGVYAPGGSASYPSSVLMSVVPALVAGVKNISLCSPSHDGKINPAILFAAKICGIKKIYKIGGAQAISAFAFGTKTITKVDKIVGPGNSYVALAKKILFGEVGIDMIAGPTDVTIIADKKNNPSFVAIDTLSQLEHGPDSKAFILVDDEKLAEKIAREIFSLTKKLVRKEIIEKSLKNSAIVVLKNLEDATIIANFIAPEHLQIATKNAKKLVKKINNAGAIFLGEFTPESIGDYIAGPSHTLPTEGTAKFSSGLSVYDFLKRISLISCEEKSFRKIAKHASNIAACEGLTAHKLSIDIRSN